MEVAALKHKSDTLRVELDKADGAGQELMQENERLRSQLADKDNWIEHWKSKYEEANQEAFDLRKAVEEWQTACQNLGKFSHRAEELGLNRAA